MIGRKGNRIDKFVSDVSKESDLNRKRDGNISHTSSNRLQNSQREACIMTLIKISQSVHSKHPSQKSAQPGINSPREANTGRLEGYLLEREAQRLIHLSGDHGS